MKIETRPIPGLQPQVGCTIWTPHDKQPDMFIQQPNGPVIRYQVERGEWHARTSIITHEELAARQCAIRRRDPVTFLSELESIDDCVYHQSPIDAEELGMDILDALRARAGLLEIWTMELPRPGLATWKNYVIVLASETELDDEPGNILSWQLYEYVRAAADPDPMDTMSLVGLGSWSVMRTILVTWMEIYDHEDGFDDIAEAMQVLKAILTHRRNIGHPGAFAY